MSGLVNMPQTVVKDDNENGVGVWGGARVHSTMNLFSNIHKGGGERKPGGSSSNDCRGKISDFTSSSKSLYNAAVLNPSTP